MKKSFKILFLFPNEPLNGIVPSNLALLSAYLKKDGFDVKLFDCSLFNWLNTESQQNMRSKLGHVKKTDIDNYVHLRETNVYDDFIKTINDYKPNLIGITLVESTIKIALSFLEKIKDKKIPIIVGGVAATFLYKKLLNTNLIDYVCVGEGEEALVELCDKMYNKKDCTNIRNIYTKNENGDIVINPLRPLINLDELLMPDFSIYDDSRIYKPFMGQVVRMVQMDFDRGCQHGCTYCGAQGLRKIFLENNCGKYYRVKSLDKIFYEVKYLIKKYKLNFVWISSETLLDLSLEKFTEFAERYKEEINLPLWCQSRLDTFTEEKTKLLAEIGCKNISVGLEHGSEKIRKILLNKHISNERIIKSVELMAKYDIFPTLNNMIGLPDETRENIFETVLLNRQLSSILKGRHNINVFTFIPFSGTKLRELCIEKGYLTEDFEIPISYLAKSTLTMPSISKEELYGLEKTLTLYILLPESYWPQIKMAEQDNEEGKEIFKKLMTILREKSYETK
jgi:radical SAM superfamily enzyme YgiQ (UPF0313 family)